MLLPVSAELLVQTPLHDRYAFVYVLIGLHGVMSLISTHHVPPPLPVAGPQSTLKPWLAMRRMMLPTPLQFAAPSLAKKPKTAHWGSSARTLMPAAKLSLPLAVLIAPPATNAYEPLAVLLRPPATVESLPLAVFPLPPETAAQDPLHCRNHLQWFPPPW